MVQVNKILNRNNYKLNQAIRTVQKASTTPDSVPPTDFYIAFGKIQKLLHNSDYCEFIKKCRPLFDEYKSIFGKEGMSYTFTKVVDSDSFIDRFINAVQAQEKKYTRSIFIPIQPTKYKS